jgi:hypothetical protein
LTLRFPASNSRCQIGGHGRLTVAGNSRLSWAVPIHPYPFGIKYVTIRQHPIGIAELLIARECGTPTLRDRNVSTICASSILELLRIQNRRQAEKQALVASFGLRGRVSVAAMETPLVEH